jgi:O-antigen ligase
MFSKKQKLSFSLPFWLLVSFFSIIIFTGGSSRADTQSLAILWPTSVVFCALGVVSLRREHLSTYRWPLYLFGALLLFATLQTLPLPPAPQQLLSGHSLTTEIDTLAGVTNFWRPSTLSPIDGWNGVAALATPLAVLVLAVQLGQHELHRLLIYILGIGILSAVFGLMQIIGGAGSPFYLYRITNVGSAVGLFANRNHAAVFLASMFPLLATFASMKTTDASKRDIYQLAAVGVGAVLIILIIITGSRSGLVLGSVGLGGAVLLYRPRTARRTERRGSTELKTGMSAWIGGLGVLSLAALAVSFSRDEALDRMFYTSSADDNRADFWTSAYTMIWQHLPFGSGNGTFAHLYQVHMPDQLLKGNYANHVHNDFIELILTNGIPGAIFIAVGLFLFLRQSFRIWRLPQTDSQSVRFARAASISIAILLIASVVDYPLRIPIIMAVFAVLVLWLTAAKHPSR